MIYLTGASRPELIALGRPDVGLMVGQGGGTAAAIGRYPFFALDCGGFGDRFHEAEWLRALDRAVDFADRCLFVVCPDRFDPDDLGGNHAATLERWGRYSDEVRCRALPVAFVCQNGCTPDDVPMDADATFIGGDTAYKLSERAYSVVAGAKAHGRWTHMGRVNSRRRVRAARLSMVDSVDGNYIKFAPDLNVGAIAAWLDDGFDQPALPLFGPIANATDALSARRSVSS